jgi:hypothetical protein
MSEPTEATKKVPFFGNVLHVTHAQANALLEMFALEGWGVFKEIMKTSQDVDVAGVFVGPQPVQMEGANQAKGSWRLAEALKSQLEPDVRFVAEQFEKELKEKAKRTTEQ